VEFDRLLEENSIIFGEKIELKKELKLLSEKLSQTLLSNEKYNLMMRMDILEQKIKNDLIMLARKKDEIERKKSYQKTLSYKRQEEEYKRKEAQAKINSQISQISQINQYIPNPSPSINNIIVSSKINQCKELHIEIKNNLSSLSSSQKWQLAQSSLHLAELLLDNLEV
jgi:hypothetical protein